MKKRKREDIDESLYNEKSLALLNIRDLRDLGRKLGVPSPTTKNKQELVGYILKIVYGEVEAERSVYGRPNTREFDINKCLSKIKRNSVMKPEDFWLENDDVIFESKVAAPTEDFDLSGQIEQRVFVEEDGKNYLRIHAFVETEHDIEVTNEFVKKFSLEIYDVVEVILNGDSFRIISINGVKVERRFESVTIEEDQIKGGTTNIFHHSTKEEIEKIILELDEHCKNINLQLMIFSQQNYENDNIKQVAFNENEGASICYKKLMHFVALCEKVALETEEFVMVIDDAEVVDRLLSSLDDDVQERIKKHLHDSISNIVSLGNVLCVYYLDKEITY